MIIKAVISDEIAEYVPECCSVSICPYTNDPLCGAQ